MDLDLFIQGGPVVLVLIILSIVGVATILFKILHYRHYTLRGLRAVEQSMDLWVNGEQQRAIDELSKNKSPYSRMLAQGIHWLYDGSKGEEQVREELNRHGQKIISSVNRMNGFIELIAYLSPMLGLLGTVLGMIEVFQGLADQAGNTGALAGGIRQALVTTAVGLAVAIPFAFVHYMLDNRAATIRHSMEDQLTRLFTVKLYSKP